MALAATDFEKIYAHLRKYWGPGFSCPQCHTAGANGQAYGYLNVVLSNTPGEIPFAGNGATFVVLTCSACGYARLIDTAHVEGLRG